MTTFSHLRAAVVSTPWAILPDRLEAIAEVLERRFAGVRLGHDEIAAIKGERLVNGVLNLYAIDGHGVLTPIEARGPSSGAAPADGGVIAVINIMGIIAQHAHQVDSISGPGGTSTERVGASFRAAMSDPSVVGIVFNIDSPGGNVHGVDALAQEIFAARGRKPMVAQVNSTMASAALWLGSAADEVVMTPGAQAGSIGVYAMHKDVSVAAEKDGVKMTFISAGKYKVEGNAFEPLGDEARQAIQSEVNDYYGDFAGAVAKFRGVKVSDVRDGFGEGRMLKDKSAVKAGIADSIGTLDDTLRRMASGKMKRKDKMKAEGGATLIAATGPGLTFTAAIEDMEVVAERTFGKEEIAPVLEKGVDAAAIGEILENYEAAMAAAGAVSEPAKADETATSENDIAAKQAAERDAFRRRRHAFRMRNAGSV